MLLIVYYWFDLFESIEMQIGLSEAPTASIWDSYDGLGGYCNIGGWG